MGHARGLRTRKIVLLVIMYSEVGCLGGQTVRLLEPICGHAGPLKNQFVIPSPPLLKRKICGVLVGCGNLLCS